MEQRVAAFSRGAAVFSIAVGVLVLAGWALDVAALKSLVPGLVTMKPNTALCFVLAGGSLLTWHASRSAGGPAAAALRAASLALGSGVLAIAAVTLSQDLFPWSAGIDEALFREPPGAVGTPYPGRMSPAVAGEFVLIGTSLLLLAREAANAAGAAQALAAGAGVIAAISFLAYVLHVPGLYRVFAFSATALHTAVTSLVLSAGLLTARPSRGWVRELFADTPGGQMGRRLLLGVAVLLPALGWLRLQGEEAGWYGTEFGIGLFMSASLVVIAALIWLTTRAANRAQARIERLNRVYAVLSQVNALIVRVRERDELFRESCRIAVEAGGLAFAWIGLADREAKRVAPAAWAGAERGFLAKAAGRLSLDVSARERGPVARAVLERLPAVANDVATDPNMPLREEFLERGVRSFAVLPLVVGGEARGVIALHADAAGFFDEQELKLFMEMAGDVAFALDHIGQAEEVEYLAYYDPLTGLANATLLRTRLAEHIAGARRHQGRLGLVLLDIERFKRINDTLGRNAGDELLRQVARRLASRGIEPAHLARVGSNLFAVLVPRVEHASEVARLEEALLRECFGSPFALGAEELRVGCRAGIAIHPEDGDDAEILFRNAEAALATAKARGEGYVFYAPQINERVAEDLRLESRLRRALEREELVLHYQPKLDLATGAVRGAEALMRWQSPELGLVPPLRFIPLMEESGLILEAGAWALRQAALDRERLAGSGLAAPRIAVNVSPVQLRRGDFIHVVRGAIRGGIDLEITESLVMEDIHASIEKLRAVRELGCEIAIDDFGTGYSSLAYLAQLPLHTLKIDRSFVHGMLDRAEMRTLVSTTVSLAHSLGLKVVAEGVETEAQAALLRELGCDEIQGYLVCRPVPLLELIAFLRQRGPRA